MVRTLEQISADSYIRRVMEEQEFDELEVNLLKNALAQKDIALEQKDTALVALQNQLAEYRRKYGALDQ